MGGFKKPVDSGVLTGRWGRKRGRKLNLNWPLGLQKLAAKVGSCGRWSWMELAQKHIASGWAGRRIKLNYYINQCVIEAYN
jgi:hypothetical protein